ncbi:MAG: 50S ribosomal protein L14e [Candidatus Odinarchaeia archaeon]
MAIIGVGRICVKTYGREAGKKCVIIDVVDKNFVLVTGPKELTGVRRRRSNIKHLEPTPVTIKIKKGADDKEILDVLKKENQLDFMKEEVKP